MRLWGFFYFSITDEAQLSSPEGPPTKVGIDIWYTWLTAPQEVWAWWICLLTCKLNAFWHHSAQHHTTDTEQSSWLLCDNFLTFCWQLKDGSQCNWPIKMQGLWEAELSFVGKPTWRLTNPTPFGTAFSFWLVSWIRSYQKVVKKMSQTNKKTISKWQHYDVQHGKPAKQVYYKQCLCTADGYSHMLLSWQLGALKQLLSSCGTS